MSYLSDLEADVAVTRERLNTTIDRIQDKLTLTGMVDEVMGQTGLPRFANGHDLVGTAVRRYTIPLMVAAAGLGFLIYSVGRQERARARRIADLGRIDTTALSAGPARVYDPDRPSSQAPIDGPVFRRPVTQS